MKVAVCAIGKWEEQYLEEWINHYRFLGVNNVIFYDNNEDSLQYDILKKYIDCGFVLYHDYRNAVGLELQSLAYNDAIQRYKNEYDWIGFFDIDEFLELVEHNSIQEFLESNQKFKVFDGVMISWLTFNDGGLVFNDHRSLNERFQEPVYGRSESIQFKSFINMRAKFLKNMVSCHHPFVSKKRCCNCNGELDCAQNKTYMCKKTYDVAYIKHYRFKTAEEAVSKILRGDCNPRSYDNEDINNRIEKFIKSFFYVNKFTPEKLQVFISNFPKNRQQIIKICKKYHQI